MPGVFSQGETLEELEQNIEDAYRETLDEGLASARPEGCDGKSGLV